MPLEERPNVEIRSGEILQTRLGEAALQKRLLRFFSEAKTLEEEQGINILYLAIGFLRWFEDDKSDVLREAPLILIPVKLNRDVRRSTFTLAAREEDLSVNLPLQERLLDQEGIKLPDLPEGDEWLPRDYFDAVLDAVSTQKRWSIDYNGVELGFFSFAKLLMFRDLSGEAWPNESILSHPLLRGLMQDGFEPENPLFPSDTKIDERFQPSDLVHVLDADGSQTLAIETVRAGRNLVIQGPPGTGKSQTIANIIAAAAHDGKTVLFIAEKMVALDVVHKRLRDNILGPNLGQLCLELHSRSANKRILIEELKATLAGGAAEPNIASQAAHLKLVRDQLNQWAADLHEPIGTSGTSPFRAIAELVRAKGLGVLPSPFTVVEAQRWTDDEFNVIALAAVRIAEVAAASGPLEQHPWFAVGNTDLQPNELDRLPEALRLASGAIRALEKRIAAVTALLPNDDAQGFRRADQAVRILELLLRVPASTQNELLALNALSIDELSRASQITEEAKGLVTSLTKLPALFRSIAFEVDITQVRTCIVAGTTSFLRRWGGPYRRASAELAGWLVYDMPKAAKARLAAVDQLNDFQRQRTRLEALALEAQKLLGALWHGNEIDFDRVIAAISWLHSVREEGFTNDLTTGLSLLTRRDLLESYPAVLRADRQTAHTRVTSLFELLELKIGKIVDAHSLQEAQLEPIAAWADRLAANIDRYDEWRATSKSVEVLRQAGQDNIVAYASIGQAKPSEISEAIRYARGEQLWRTARAANPRLSALAEADRHQVAQAFKRLERERRASVAALIRHRHSLSIPRGAMGDMGIIRGEIARRRGHMPIRKLIQRTGSTIQKIKPVFLMSPISVAQFLPPGAIEFDLLVIDEASQVRPEDALGVIARAKQLVVVGDAKQLPPTNFFNRLLSDDVHEDEEDDDAVDDALPDALAGAAKVAELESILTLCEARGLPSKMLRWHYRSKHHSLIEVSNESFYGGKLFLPPSPTVNRHQDGLVFVQVAGSYDRGGKRTNEIEARRIVEALTEHASKHPSRSIGVVTFSGSQRDLIATLIDDARRKDPVLDAFISDQVEDTFVKNLENVQGDERDHILVSVGYGPRTPGNRLDSANFGPVSKEGGERRLNVLFTRARHRCVVFCSFDPADIDLDRARSQGAETLKRYLTYAQTGILSSPRSTTEEHDSPFEEDVARVIRSFGYMVDAQVGTAGFKIDLGVRARERPGQFILAVECDGAAYHGALWARERDRLRREILEQQGWTFHRIWSTDWFYRRDKEIQRLHDVLGSVSNASSHNSPRPVEEPGSASLATEPSRDEPQVFVASAYTEARPSGNYREEPHEVPPSRMSEIVASIVNVEGPIHEEEIARRVASFHGKDRAGSRIQEATLRGLKYLVQSDKSYLNDGGFWLTTSQKADPPVRDRSAASLSIQRGSMLPPLEIRAATQRAISDNGAIRHEELIIAVARMFGYQRTGPELKSAIGKVLVAMLGDGELKETADGWLTRF